MAVYGPQTGRTGSSSKPITVSGGSHNFIRNYFRSAAASGDVRAHYEDLEHVSTGSGDTLRIRGIVNSLLAAAAGTINAIHATGRVAAGKTVSGALNAIRATLEVAGTTPTPGGTLSVIQLDDNLSDGTVLGEKDAYLRVTHSGAGELVNLFNLPAPGAKSAYLTDMFVAVHADSVVTHAIKITDDAGTDYWIQCTTDTPNN